MMHQHLFACLLVFGLPSIALGGSVDFKRNVTLHSHASVEVMPRAAAQLHSTRANASSTSAPPCTCQASSSTWSKCTRTVPKCIFIDLGAADGNSFNSFLNNGYGSLANCPSGGQWQAVLVEANPKFSASLEEVAARHPGVVDVRAATAAFMCEGTTSFYLDTVNVEQNHWGSSMSPNHRDVISSGKQKVTVNTVNLNRVLFEQTIPDDYVLVKMDIEGAEYDIVPCLAGSPSVALMDALWMEQHDVSWGVVGNNLGVMDEAKKELQTRGVYMPDYHSQTLFLAKKADFHRQSHL